MSRRRDEENPTLSAPVVMLLQHFHRHPVPQIVRLELGVADAAFGRAE
jgi:hypothetical protein